MVNISDPVTQWAFIILITVVMGTFLLIAVAFIRRWQQIRYLRYVHALQREYRPLVAKLLAGQRNPAAITALRELPMADLELLFDPLFSRRKLPARHLVFLRALCAELGLIALWQTGKRGTPGFTSTRRSETLPAAPLCAICCAQKASGIWEYCVIGQAGACW
jgi:hypothetical protein